MTTTERRAWRVLQAAAASAAVPLLLASLAVAAPDAPRLVPVEAVTPTLEPFAPDLALTGQIEARIQSNIAFRTSGKVTVRKAEVGQHVTADEVLATLDPTEQQADVTNAEAALTAAQAQLQQADLTFKRQQSLITSGFTTRASFDQAQEALRSAQAQVAVAQASLRTATEQRGYTDLTAGHDGIIVSRTVEAGQVVQAGQTVFVLAQDGARDAVFAIPEVLLTTPPEDKRVDVALQSDPSQVATGTVREISPILDKASGTVTVKIGLDRTPPQMTLGAAVVGRAHWQHTQVFAVPWSALFEAMGHPAVWVLDDQDRVSLQPVQVQSYGRGTVILAGSPGARLRVVTAGGQLLYPGQQVTVVRGAAP